MIIAFDWINARLEMKHGDADGLCIVLFIFEISIALGARVPLWLGIHFCFLYTFIFIYLCSDLFIIYVADGNVYH